MDAEAAGVVGGRGAEGGQRGAHGLGRGAERVGHEERAEPVAHVVGGRAPKGERGIRDGQDGVLGAVHAERPDAVAHKGGKRAEARVLGVEAEPDGREAERVGGGGEHRVVGVEHERGAGGEAFPKGQLGKRHVLDGQDAVVAKVVGADVRDERHRRPTHGEPAPQQPSARRFEHRHVGAGIAEQAAGALRPGKVAVEEHLAVYHHALGRREAGAQACGLQHPRHEAHRRRLAVGAGHEAKGHVGEGGPVYGLRRGQRVLRKRPGGGPAAERHEVLADEAVAGVRLRGHDERFARGVVARGQFGGDAPGAGQGVVQGSQAQGDFGGEVVEVHRVVEDAARCLEAHRGAVRVAAHAPGAEARHGAGVQERVEGGVPGMDGARGVGAGKVQEDSGPVVPERRAGHAPAVADGVGGRGGQGHAGQKLRRGARPARRARGGGPRGA